jgi:hypothetical protein
MSVAFIIGGAIGTIVLAGVLGGWINCLQARKTAEPIPTHRSYYFLLSIAAAFSVPLFLSLTKSELLKNVLATEPPLKIEDWFIFFAVCLIAAIYSQVFLESVSKRLLQRVDSVEQRLHETAEKADEAETNASDAIEKSDKLIERLESGPPGAPETAAPLERAGAEASPAAEGATPKIDINEYDEPTRKVISALRSSRYSLRTVSGIARDAAPLSRAAVRQILTRLMQDGLVLETIGPKTGNVLYMIRLDALRTE